jgi:hypothetical protein
MSNAVNTLADCSRSANIFLEPISFCTSLSVLLLSLCKSEAVDDPVDMDIIIIFETLGNGNLLLLNLRCMFGID